jgi:hypothetical protein
MEKELKKVIEKYSQLVENIDDRAREDNGRAYGGKIRAGKGGLVESIAKDIIETAWSSLSSDKNRLSFDKKRVKVYIEPDYIKKIPDEEIRNYIQQNIDNYFYTAKTDVPVYIDGTFVMGVECKAYAENAMLKRVLIDFTLLKGQYPKLVCVLFQLESQLGGDYSQPLIKKVFGSHSSHTLMSYFDVDLKIITLLEGERKVDKPIHKKDYYKELKYESLYKAANELRDMLKPFV